MCVCVIVIVIFVVLVFCFKGSLSLLKVFQNVDLRLRQLEVLGHVHGFIS